MCKMCEGRERGEQIKKTMRKPKYNLQEGQRNKVDKERKGNKYYGRVGKRRGKESSMTTKKAEMPEQKVDYNIIMKNDLEMDISFSRSYS